jgi:hypothetical protein
MSQGVIVEEPRWRLLSLPGSSPIPAIVAVAEVDEDPDLVVLLNLTESNDPHVIGDVPADVADAAVRAWARYINSRQVSELFMASLRLNRPSDLEDLEEVLP